MNTDRRRDTVKVDTKMVTFSPYVTVFHLVEPGMPMGEPEIRLLDAPSDENPPGTEVRFPDTPSDASPLGQCKLESQSSVVKGEVEDGRETDKPVEPPTSVNDPLTMISNVLATADDSHTEATYKGMLNDLRLLRARNYKVRVTISDGGVPAKCTVVIVDTGAGPNFVRRSWLPRRWLDLVKKVPGYSFNSAAKTPLKVTGVVRLQMTMGDATMFVGFLVADNLAVDVLFGTAFIDTHVKTISPKRRRITMTQGGTTGILDDVPGKQQRDVTAMTRDRNEGDEHDSKRPATHCRVCRKVTLKARTETPVMVRSNDSGLVVLGPHDHLLDLPHVHMARGIADVTTGRPFYVLVGNTSDKSVHLPKGMIIASTVDVPDVIMDASSLSNDRTKGNDETINAIPLYRRDENRDERMARHFEVKETDGKNEKTDWRTLINFNDEYAEYRDEFISMLEKYESMWDGHIGQITVAKHRIDLVDEGMRPIHAHPYRAGPKRRELEKAELDNMLKEGIAEPATTEWASPIVFAPKKDGTLRFCVDYRRLNAMTIRDSYPIPRMDECIDSLGNAQVFSTLDANAGYWQVELDERDKDKTAFVTHHGLYRYTRMPFGLKNAPATFQRAMDVILASVKWQTAIVYLDDVIVFSTDIGQHVHQVDRVLRLMSEAGMTLKLKKCFFFCDKIDYLGHVISPGKLEVASKTTEAIKGLSYPTDVSQMRSFLGLCNDYRRFVPNFTRLAKPLNRKLKKDRSIRFELDDSEKEAVDALKEKLTSTPVLALPRATGQFTIDTDACDYQVGCVLLQRQDDDSLRPIGYWSRTLNPAETRYDTTHKECLAVVWAVLMLRPYVEGTHFVVRTDHQALKWILDLKESTGRLARWRLRLMEFDFEVVHKPGAFHKAPDALSRLPTTEVDNTEVDDEVPTYCVPDVDDLRGVDVDVLPSDWDQYMDVLTIVGEPDDDESVPDIPDIETFIREQKEDPYCREMAAEVGRVGSQFDVDENGVLCRRASTDQALQRVVPRTLRRAILYHAHYPCTAGHPGARKMYDTLRRQYYWPHQATDVYVLVERCPECRKNRPSAKHQRELKLFPAAGPLEFIAMDILGPLPRSKKGNRFITVMTDRYSKLTRAVPSTKTTAPQVALIFLDNWVIPYGIPSYVLTDNGPQFTSKFFACLCAFLGSKLLNTTAYHPQTNGQAERFNRTIVARMRHYVNEHQTDWDDYVQPLTYGYNCQVHRTTGTTPFSLVLSREPPGPMDIVPTKVADGESHGETLTPRQMKARVLDKLRLMSARAEEKARRAQVSYKRYFDRRVRHVPQFEVGDWVYIDNPPNLNMQTSTDEVSRKLKPKKAGPYQVKQVHSHTAVVDEDGLLNTVSTDRLTIAKHANEDVDAEAGDAFRSNDGQHDHDGTVDDDRKNEYVVDKIVRHVDDEGDTKYVVRWYGYGADEDTVEPAEHLPRHFIDRYWKRVGRQTTAKTKP